MCTNRFKIKAGIRHSFVGGWWRHDQIYLEGQHLGWVQLRYHNGR